MAEERGVVREYPAWKPKPASWTKLFRTFLVALDPFKLLVAAAGILATAVGWWIISAIFYSAWTVPSMPQALPDNASVEEKKASIEKRKAFEAWALMHELAGPSNPDNKAYADYKAAHPEELVLHPRLAHGYTGKFRTMPWAEDRGPHPFLVARSLIGGRSSDRKDTLSLFLTNQVPNLVEPLLKFLSPVYYLFDSKANGWTRLFLLILIIWLLVVWAFVGGIITRMAALQLSGKEGGTLRESYKFVKKRYLSYLLSPLSPILVIGFLVICCMLFGLLHWIPLIGDLVDGLLWWLPLLAGLLMTLLLLGMIGYPLMYATLSTEGSDTFDAMSRSYNYVYESPWHYLFYSFLAILYGAVLTLFVLLVGSMATYLAKWGVSKWPTFGADRSPEYLFIYAPESLGWRKLLLDQSPAAIDDHGVPLNAEDYNAFMKDYAWYNYIGSGMVSFWVTLVFLMVIGFGYSYFWTAATQIYLLMRKRVDETDLDEVYVEEEAPPAPVVIPPTAPAPTPAASEPVPTAPVAAPVALTPLPAETEIKPVTTSQANINLDTPPAGTGDDTLPAK
jgi:hypothetical protein